MIVLAKSPSFIRGPVCFRKDIHDRLKGLLQEGLLSLHNDPQGQQLLNLFRVDKLVPFRQVYLDGVIALVEEYCALRERSGKRN